VAEPPGGTPRGADALATYVSRALTFCAALGSALFFTGLGLSLFVLAFLGYFTVPFIFLAGALFILATGSTTKTFRRLRERMTR
jgi:hypothetical protein